MIKQPKQLIVIGDSGVYGWGDPECGGWCERIRLHWMSIPNAPLLYQLGIRGDGLERVAKRWENEWNCRGELRRHKPEGLLLSVGINDSARVGSQDGRPQLSSEAYRYGLRQLLHGIQKHTQVLVMGLTAIDESCMPFAECLWFSNKSCLVYEAQIEETCLELDIPFLPIINSMLEEPDWPTWLEPDGIHLNSTGHNWLYQKVVNWPSLLSWAELEPIKTLTPIRH